MNSQIAILLYSLFILFFFLRENRKKNEGVSKSIWIPLVWMLLASSRPVARWLDPGRPVEAIDSYSEGSPVDAVVILFLITCAFFILSKRKVGWAQVILKNKVFCLYLFYCVLSISWSENSFVSFKRWLKDFGSVAMALVVLTEERPYKALAVVLRRFAYFLIPLSVIFIKYIPDLGRAYHMGEQMATGVATQKNGLGQLCMLSGTYFSWALLMKNTMIVKLKNRLDIFMDVAVISMIVWLLYTSNSMTSIICLVIITGLLCIARVPSIYRAPGRIIRLMVAVVCIFAALKLVPGVSDLIFEMIGRDANLTDRVPLWEELMRMVRDPIWGFGYQNFWLGERMKLLWEKFGPIVQAHNGYLQVYLDLGLIGLTLLISSLVSGLLTVRKYLFVDYPAALFRLCVIVMIVVYNWSEASLGGFNTMWTLLLIGIIDMSEQNLSPRLDSENKN